MHVKATQWLKYNSFTRLLAVLVFALGLILGLGSNEAQASQGYYQTFPGCTAPTATAGNVGFGYCLTKSPTNPAVFNITLSLTNRTTQTLDFSHTVVCNMHAGVAIGQISGPTDRAAAAANGTQFVWHASVLAPGQSASVSYFVTKAANSLLLVDSIKITGVNTALNSPFTAILPQIEAETGITLDLIPQAKVLGTSGGTAQGGAPNLPPAGFAPTTAPNQPDKQSALLLLLADVVLGGVGVVWLRRRTKNKQRKQ